MEFVAELYVSRGDRRVAAGLAELARRGAEELAGEGAAVRYVRSIFMPEDETCLLLYEAASAEEVHEAVSRASLAGRVVLSERVPEKTRDEGGTR